MTNKHTPAPWEKVRSTKSLLGVRSNKGFICSLNQPSFYQNQESRYERDINEMEANAHLIAAAPDLLEALEGMIDGYTIGLIPEETILRAKSAFAKAKNLT